MNYKLLYACFSIALITAACKPKMEMTDPEKGEVDASRYVAIGSSMTAGIADGAISYESQENSFAAILAKQLRGIGAGDFSIPYVPQNSAGISIIPGNTVSVTAKFTLGYKTDCKGVTSLSPMRLSATDNYGVFSSNLHTSSGPFQNMGVPDAKSFHITHSGYGNATNAATGYYNPYFARMASGNGASVLSDALNQNPTFFTLNIGMNDVLSYALAGGAYDSITDQGRFDASIDQMVNQLTATGAKGLIMGIPDFTKLPYFTTIPYNGLTLIRQSQVDSINTIYSPIGFTFTLGVNSFMMLDPNSVNGFVRQMTEGDLILLSTPLDSVKCHRLGTSVAFPNRMVLSVTEVQAIRTAITGYNNKLRSVAQLKGLAYVDLESFYRSLQTGVIYNGVSVNAQFVKGGAFSLDGLYLNPIGNALLANECIKAINSTYKSGVRQVEATKYRGTVFP